MSDNSLEQQIKDLMGGLEFKPDAAVWDKVRAEIAPEKKRRVIAWWLPVLLLLVMGAGIFALLNRPGKQPNAQQAVTAVNTTAPAAGNTTTSPAGTTGIVNEAATARVAHEDNRTAAGEAEAGMTTSSALNNTIAHKTGQAAQSRVKTNTNKTIHAKLAGGKPLQKNTATINNAIVLHGAVDPSNTDPELTQQFLRLPDHAIIQQDMPLVSQELLTGVSDPKDPFQPATAMPLPPVIKRKETAKWQTLFFANTGVSAVVGADASTTDEQERQRIENEKSLSFNSPQSGQGGNPFTGSASANVYTKSRSSSGIAFGAGILAGKQLFGKLELQLGLRYQYAAYSINTSYLTDSFTRSMVTGLFANIPTLNHTEVYNYRLHYLGVPVLLHYSLGKPLGITAGVMNDFVVSAKQNSQSIRSEMHVWNPSAYFAFAIKIPAAGKCQWQVMPYLQYGLSTGFKNFGEQRLLQPGVQVLLRLNN